MSSDKHARIDNQSASQKQRTNLRDVVVHVIHVAFCSIAETTTHLCGRVKNNHFRVETFRQTSCQALGQTRSGIQWQLTPTPILVGGITGTTPLMLSCVRLLALTLFHHHRHHTNITNTVSLHRETRPAIADAYTHLAQPLHSRETLPQLAHVRLHLRLREHTNTNSVLRCFTADN